MAPDTMWVKTHNALKNFIQTLTCQTCKQKLSNPQQFLNCGHYACGHCVGNETRCIQCNIPGEVPDVYSDRSISDLLFNLNIIAEALELPVPQSSTISSGDKCSTNTRKQTATKTYRNKISNETFSGSVCGSTISKSTHKGKTNKIIPKSINKTNKKGETALHIACSADNIERVKKLLEAGANPNTKDNAGWTPLQEAANYGFREICEILLNAGALPDTHGYDSRTALHEAVIIDDYELALLLIKFNANIKVFDNVGKEPKDYCKSKEMTKLFENLQNTGETTSETLYEPERSISVLDKTLNHSISEPKIVLYGSNLKPQNSHLLIKLGLKKKLKIVTTLKSSVSHVIIEADSCDNVKMTFDVLLTIMYGKWLLASNCLLILMDSENITANDLSLFEVNLPQLDDGPARSRENEEKQNPKLFNNCHFYFAIKSYESIEYDNMYVTKEDLMKLVTAGDGITLSREPKPEDIQGSLSPFHAAHKPKHSLHKCTHYIIYIPDKSNSNSSSNSNRIIYNMPFLKSLPLMWFMESILRFKLIDPKDLGL